ncbi:MAG: peptidoglycan DD-metalloendopeptidase family protein [Alphaproteobacteria bacterium]|nr:peptidoglycan DD-metalloendopeptidase family protein [Alphaproteobacteria bacterium]
MRYRQRLRRAKPVKYQATENKSFFSEKEFIIRSNERMKVFKISPRLQWFVFGFMLMIGVWAAYSYQMYSVSDRIISYQEKKLDETRSAYVNLMSDFVTVHKNISDMVENIGKPDEPTAGNVEEYLKKAEIIEEKIKQITAQEDWIDEDVMDKRNAVREAQLRRDVALKEKALLEEKVAHLEAAVSSLEAFEMDILKKIEGISSNEMNKIKSSISAVNVELKKRGKYYNPLANSKKDSKGGVFIPESLREGGNKALEAQARKTFEALDYNDYYQEAIKKLPLGKPVWTYWLSSPFGKRTDPFNSKSAVHKGVDLASNKGNKVKSMAEGKVTKAGVANGYGKVIEIDHGNGFKTKYAHLNAIYVKTGQAIEQGQAIGEVGSTGRSTGPHLHYEIMYGGVQVDPMVFIKAK